jgi:hypothetical protein
MIWLRALPFVLKLLLEWLRLEVKQAWADACDPHWHSKENRP